MVNWQDPVTIITEFGAFCDVFYAALSLFDVFANFYGIKICKTLTGAFVKLIHVVDGIYMYVLLFVPSFANCLDIFLSWEFICNLSFEWSLLRGRRQWRWTSAVGISYH